MFHLERQISAIQWIQTTDSAVDVQRRFSQRTFHGDAHIARRQQRFQRPHFTFQCQWIHIDHALGVQREEFLLAWGNAHLVELKHAIVFLRFTIDEAHVVQVRAPNDHGDLGRAFLIEFFNFFFGILWLRDPHDPVALAIGPELKQNVCVIQFEQADIGRPRNQRPEADLHDDFADLDHLRLRASRRIAQANAFGTHVDNREYVELEGAINDKRPAGTLRDQRFDASLVPTEIAKREVQRDSQQHGADNAKKESEKAFARHVNVLPSVGTPK